jgi:tetratricopeptide (TPR) repeat protein
MMNDSEGEQMEKRVRREQEKFYKKAMKKSDIPQPARAVLHALSQSHAGQASMLRRHGKLREAIEEYGKDTKLQAANYGEVVVAEEAYCHIGDIYMELGEIEDAISAYESALDLWRMYNSGRKPYDVLAAAYLKQERFDDAVHACKEALEESGDAQIEELLAEAERHKHT